MGSRSSLGTFTSAHRVELNIRGKMPAGWDEGTDFNDRRGNALLRSPPRFAVLSTPEFTMQLTMVGCRRSLRVDGAYRMPFL